MRSSHVDRLLRAGEGVTRRSLNAADGPVNLRVGSADLPTASHIRLLNIVEVLTGYEIRILVLKVKQACASVLCTSNSVNKTCITFLTLIATMRLISSNGAWACCAVLCFSCDGVDNMCPRCASVRVTFGGWRATSVNISVHQVVAGPCGAKERRVGICLFRESGGTSHCLARCLRLAANPFVPSLGLATWIGTGQGSFMIRGL